MSHQSTPSIKDRILTLALRLLPQHLLSAMMYKVARLETPWVKNLIIKNVVRKYGVNLSEAAESDPEQYPSFNAFFTRALKPEARPIDPDRDALVSPVDGKVSQTSNINSGTLIQAKGFDYALDSLVAGHQPSTEYFKDGLFTTIYLSPKDYHRIHMPIAGRLTEMIFVPGSLFSVSEATTQLVPNLFARNERLICLFETAVGPMAVILVGAIFVGSMETVWAGEIKPKSKQPTHWQYGDQDIYLEKGEELGRFNMGSTVILLFGEACVKWSAQLEEGCTVRLGESIATLRHVQSDAQASR